MTDLPRSEVLRLTAKLADLRPAEQQPQDDKYYAWDEEEQRWVPWNPYNNRAQFDWLVEKTKISLVWHEDTGCWMAMSKNGLIACSYESRTEAGLQCAARIQLAKEGK